MLEVKNLYKSFGKLEVLKGIDFDLQRGEVLAIIGASGSGKTTLLRCLNFLEKPEKGQIILDNEILFDGESEENLNEREIRKRRLHFGLVFQAFNLFPQYSVIQNVMLAPKLIAKENNDKQALAEIEEYAMHLLKRTGLEDKRNSYPCHLSGGQQQRVAIARALALNPEILCFDEPTSALDPELTGEVLKVIRELRYTDATMIVVTHEMEFAKRVADKIMFMCDGIIAEMGTPEEVFEYPQNPKTIAFLRREQETKLY